jgi:hypothetical protein
MKDIHRAQETSPHKRKSLNERVKIFEMDEKVTFSEQLEENLPVAKYVKEKGFDAYGFDISQKAMERAEKTAAIRKAAFDNDEYPYLCGPHPNMVGTVVVTES